MLSFPEAPEDAACFFAEIQQFKKRRDVFVNLKNVEIVTPDAIAMLVALIRFHQVRGTWINGNYPKNRVAHEVIRKSGFDQQLATHTGAAKTHHGMIMGHRDLSMTSRQAEPEIAKKLIDFARRSGGPHRRLFGSYEHLIECMANTHEHADRDDRRVDCFTFLDMGVGIFESFAMGLMVRAYNYVTKPRHFILEQVLHRKMRSRTRKHYRGRGLPRLYEACKTGEIQRLTIVTNDIVAHATTDRYDALPTEFKGSLLYWEVPHHGSTGESLDR